MRHRLAIDINQLNAINVDMERSILVNSVRIVGGVIVIQMLLASACVGLSPCMHQADSLGRYTISGGSSNIWSHGTPSGLAVHVSVNCDADATAQSSVTSQCLDGTWRPAWPRCEKPCSVPTNRGEVRQFVIGSTTRPVTLYGSDTLLPDGTELVARCRDPGKYRLLGDQRRTCLGGTWTGEEPQCQLVANKVLFYGAHRSVASNGTVVVPVYSQNPQHLDVACRSTKWGIRNPQLTVPPECTNINNRIESWRHYTIRLNPISTECSGIFTCSKSLSSSHHVHVIFKAAECEVPPVPEHGRLSQQPWRRLHPGGIAQHGTILNFECDEDYDLIGSSNTTCHIGEWSRDPPVCEESSGSG